MGTNLSGRRPRRAVHWALWQQGPPVKETKTGSRRISADRSAAAKSGECIPEKIEYLGCREGTAREKAKVIWEPRYEYKLLLAVVDLPRSTYYYYTKKQKEPNKHAKLKEEICAIVAENKGRYGCRRVTQELRNRGLHHDHKLVMKLMQQMGLSSKVRMKKYRSYKGEVGKIASNLLERDFHSEKPNRKWVTDVTEFSLFGEKIYLLPVLNLCSEDLVSYTISDWPVLSVVTSMLDAAFATIPDDTGPILHADQGGNTNAKNIKRCWVKRVFGKAWVVKATAWTMLRWRNFRPAQIRAFISPRRWLLGTLQVRTGWIPRLLQ